MSLLPEGPNQDPTGHRAIALATGYLDARHDELVLAPRKQACSSLTILVLMFVCRALCSWNLCHGSRRPALMHPCLQQALSAQRSMQQTPEGIANAPAFCDDITRRVLVLPQVVVVVTSRWDVLCFDHNLRLMWTGRVKVSCAFPPPDIPQ